MPDLKGVTLSVTNLCNLRCRHCWPDSGLGRAVPLRALREIIHGLSRHGAKMITLTGGEILTRPDWPEIVRCCFEIPTFEEILIQTNGTLLTEKIAAILSRMDRKRIRIQVSLDGASPLSHDRLRGQGTFHRAMGGLYALADAGLGDRTVIAFTEMHHNFDELPDLLQLAQSISIGRVISSTLVMGGRARSASGLELPTVEQYHNLLFKYTTDESFRMLYERMGMIAAIEWYRHGTENREMSCICGESPYITSKGILYPCPMLQADDLAVHDLFGRPFAETLAIASPRWKHLEALRELRYEKLGECTECPGREHCRGGCMGRAMLGEEGLRGVEDRCYLRRGVYSLNPGCM